jgi:hypothetical protein
VGIERPGDADEDKERYERNGKEDGKLDNGGELLEYPEEERIGNEEKDEKNDESRLGSRRAQQPLAPCQILSFDGFHHFLSPAGLAYPACTGRGPVYNA